MCSCLGAIPSNRAHEQKEMGKYLFHHLFEHCERAFRDKICWVWVLTLVFMGWVGSFWSILHNANVFYHHVRFSSPSIFLSIWSINAPLARGRQSQRTDAGAVAYMMQRAFLTAFERGPSNDAGHVVGCTLASVVHVGVEGLS